MSQLVFLFMSSIDWDEIKAKIQAVVQKRPKTPPTDSDKLVPPYVTNTLRNNNQLFEMLHQIDTSQIDIVSDTMFFLLILLFILENNIGYIINTLIYDIIRQEHHDLYDENSRTFAASINDIIKTSLSVKIMFLEKHGHSYIKQIANRNLRNAIAHSNFKIDKDGCVIILKNNRFSEKKTPAELLEIYKNVVKMLMFIILM